MSDNILDKIRASASNGLTKQETEAIIGQKMTDDQLLEFNKVKGIIKIKAKQDEKKAEDEKKDQELAKLKQIYKKPAALEPVVKRYKKEDFMAEIEANYGIITLLCAKLDCTARQFYNAVDEWKLRDYLKECKQKLVGLAEKVILDCLVSENENIKLKAAETTLKSLGKDEWAQGPQVNIAQQINVSDKETAIKNIFGIED